MDNMSECLTLEMIPDGFYRKIAAAIGVDNLVKLTEIAGGTTIYLPKTDSLLRPVRDANIKAEFNGFNHIELAQKYNVTDRWIRQLCGEGFVEGQLNFADIMDDS